MSVTNKLNAWINCLSNNGIQHVYISPGSRNAPLIRAFVQNPTIKCYSAIDERSAGFLALGAAISLKKPVALLCTSGTALLNYYPALTEAFYAGIPLLAISADRPAELIDQWEGQCIRQNDIFSNHLGASILLDPANQNIDQLEKSTQKIVDLLYQNKPVHVNIPLSEPLYNNFTTLEYVEINCKPLVPIQNPPVPAALLADLNKASKVLVLNGHSIAPYNFRKETGLVLNDVVSNKWNKASPRFWDALFLCIDDGAKKELEPDLLITSGTSIISKPLRNWLRTIPNLKQWHIGKQDPVGNPFFKDISIWPINEVDAFELLAPQLESKPNEYNLKNNSINY
jgi:2-succinyl-5-enolpyruvyl-6-hydroxy-3-cyclohexene-1-carboxylate synthase